MFQAEKDMITTDEDVKMENLILTSKLKIFNTENYKGLGTTEKEKKQEETHTGR